MACKLRIRGSKRLCCKEENCMTDNPYFKYPQK